MIMASRSNVNQHYKINIFGRQSLFELPTVHWKSKCELSNLARKVYWRSRENVAIVKQIFCNSSGFSIELREHFAVLNLISSKFGMELRDILALCILPWLNVPLLNKINGHVP